MAIDERRREWVTNPQVLHWLASLGYDVVGKPAEELDRMFRYEARQWELAPEELELLIAECCAEVHGGEHDLLRLAGREPRPGSFGRSGGGGIEIRHLSRKPSME